MVVFMPHIPSVWFNNCTLSDHDCNAILILFPWCSSHLFKSLFYGYFLIFLDKVESVKKHLFIVFHVSNCCLASNKCVKHFVWNSFIFLRFEFLFYKLTSCWNRKQLFFKQCNLCNELWIHYQCSCHAAFAILANNKFEIK